MENLQPTLDGMSEREIFEGMQPDAIVDLILSHGETISAYERTMNLASDVLEGAYGLTVEHVLAERESKQNGKI